MRIFAIVFATALFALLGVAPAGAQTRQELKLYNKIMRRGVTIQSATKNLAKLQNQDLLTRIALEHRFEIRDLAVKKIDSQDHLIEIARVTSYPYVKGEAIKRIESEDALFQIFLTSGQWMSSYYHLLNSDVIVRLVRQPDYDVDAKHLLIEKYVEDQELLYAVLSDTTMTKSHAVAFGKLTDQTLLTEVVKNHNNLNIVNDAVRRITDQNTLADIAKTHRGLNTPLLAIDRLTDQNLLWEVVTSKEERTVGTTNGNIAYTMSDNNTALEETERMLRKRAANRLTDQSLLMGLVTESDDQEIRREAFSKLDSASLASIAASRPQGDPMAVAARVTAKTSDWGTEINNSRQRIDEVISAMALVPSVAKPTVANIVDACHKYIRKGDEAKIPDLEFLLNNYGDMRLAEDYLNCGNQRLYDIGAAWARQHGYYIGTGAGSQRATWGSQR